MAKKKAPRKGEIKTEEKKLTLKQQRFIDAYRGEARGNGRLAAELAGYAGNENTLSSIAKENLRKTQIRDAINEIAGGDPAILTRDERQRMLSEMAEFCLDTKDRLKAIELLGKTQGDYVQRIEADVNNVIVPIILPENGMD